MVPDAYLDRIRVARSHSPNLAFLTVLQRGHLNAVPFENLNIPLGLPVPIDNPSLFQKIVILRRGGFCYELNGLFGWLLEALGFDVTFVSAQVYNPDRREYGAPFDHMALLVRLDQLVLADVGFGDGFRSPLAFPNGHGEDVSGEYQLRPYPHAKDSFLLEKRETAGWIPAYRFTTANQPRESYRARCEYHQTSPESSFTQRVICTRATHDGRMTLTANSLTITENGLKRSIPIETPAAFLDHLRVAFEIDLLGSTPLDRQEILARLKPFMRAEPA